ncbi:sterol desaturase family protein [Pseudodesulfovibrio indicus]|uniref:sterol desaturase family protein n=1 Tax=Pseudodesulfovibrio indicus TaxID=1716143 RepID=UPI002930C52F|nr:sterol desaturase family protein [Pseudodesulfovibrio indicus]
MNPELLLRLGSFLAVLVVMGVAETLLPRRPLSSGKARRWFANLSISFLSAGLARLAAPLVPAALAAYCAANHIGLLHLVPTPPALAWLVSLAALDLLIYGQHVAFHHYRPLWRVHRMHHADLDIDASTGVRFHPIEIVLSLFLKLAAVFLLGPPPGAVILFEVLLNGCALFNHANLRLPLNADRKLRLFLVTPDMHRVHHSTDMREANRNFGFTVPFWDRLFGTYKDQPDLGHDRMHIGLNIFRHPQYGGLLRMLTIPFR